MQAYEYKVQSFHDDFSDDLVSKELTALGKQGWRLMGPPIYQPGFPEGGEDNWMVYVFERALA